MITPQPDVGRPELMAVTEQSFFTHFPESAQLARRWSARVVANDWQYSAEVADAVALCVAELSANAVRHTAHVVDGTTRGFLVALQGQADAVRVEVHDAGDDIPLLRQAAADEEGGRGLLLVDALCRAWGSHPRKPLGKVVWCEVACA